MSVNPGLKLPRAELPRALDLPRMTLKMPVPNVPVYKPIIIPPSDLERPEETQPADDEKTEQPEAPKLQIPVIDIEMPLPELAVVVTAVTTAVIAVTTTTVTQSLFEPIKKKVQKQLQSKVDAWKKKRKEKASLIKSKESEESSKKNK